MDTPILGSNLVGAIARGAEGAASAAEHAAEGAASAAEHAAASALSPFEALGKFFHKLTEASTWINVAKVLAGIVLIGMSILELSPVRV